MRELQQLFESDLARQASQTVAPLRRLSDLPQATLDAQYEFELSLTSSLQSCEPGTRSLPGFCAVCRKSTDFEFEWDGCGPVNWREALACRHCAMINRWRASIDLSLTLIDPESDHRQIYVTERLSPVFRFLSNRLPGIIGSEFHGRGTRPGARCFAGLKPYRHEDVTRLSFSDCCLRYILSFDVLEHVPDYRTALKEFHRVLEPGGKLILSVPFAIKLEETVVRAILEADGTVRHLMEPEYHGDPVKKRGVLCYHLFGWDLLEAAREAGFSQPILKLVWNPAKGYLGLGQCIIVAQKPPA